MKRFFCLLIIIALLLSVTSIVYAEGTNAFDETVFTDANYIESGDVFTDRKVFYTIPDSLPKNKKFGYADYSTNLIFFGMKADTKIFGKSAKEEGSLPIVSNNSFHPSIVYDGSHTVPYTFVVALSLDTKTDYNWLYSQGPYGIMIATSNNVYTFKRFVPSNENGASNVVFFPVDEEAIKMFYDISEMGDNEEVLFRLTSGLTETQDFSVKGSGSMLADEVVKAWDLYVQAGGTNQDLSIYANTIEIKSR